MKILCALDFSNTSLNAAKWINAFLSDLGGGEITFLHCLGIQHRAIAFNPLEDILKDNAEIDIKNLIKEISVEGNTYKSHIVKADPKSYIIEYASHMKVDWIVTGTKGLSALKDMTVGSLTEHCIKNSHLPVLAIPLEAAYKKPEKIVLGIDHKIIDNVEILKPIKSIANVIDTKLYLLHINTTKEDKLTLDPTFEVFFNDINYELIVVPKTGQITETLNDFCDNNNIDILIMIHHRRNWLQEMFQKSITKKELFNFKQPLIILPE